MRGTPPVPPLPSTLTTPQQSHEGGYGQTPYGEALGGTTYCALAALHLVPRAHQPAPLLGPAHRRRTVHWLVQNQGADGGFAGRTNKISDACYCFWCGAALAVRCFPRRGAVTGC